MPEYVDPILIATPVFILCVIAEMIYVHRSGKGEYQSTDSFVSLMMGLGNTIVPALIGGFTVIWAFYVYDNWRVVDLGFGVLPFLTVLVLDDFKYYWVHRLGHRVRWMWASHVIHHSSQHYNLTTALRQTWTGPISGGFLLATPLFILGFHPALVAFAGAINLIYQFWIHTEAIDKCPDWFEAIFNTPSHHRVHHSTLPEHLDRNYAGIFIVWDRLFGTFEPEDKERRPCRYGLVQDLGTFNPLRVALHEWINIGVDWRSTRRPSDWIRYALKPPGWSPDGSRKTSEMIKAEYSSEQEDKKASVRL